MHFLYIFLGGGLGAVSRFALSSGVQRLAENTRLQKFPIGILACNILGSFLIGLIIGFLAARNQDHGHAFTHLPLQGFLAPSPPSPPSLWIAINSFQKTPH